MITNEKGKKPDVPEGYEMIPIDINEAHLKLELKKLRSRAKPIKEKEEVKEEKKDAGKGKKDDKGAKKEDEKQEQKEQVGVVITEEELSLIEHNYVYIIFKRSDKPENAIFSIDIVMADEEKGKINFNITNFLGPRFI